MHNSHLHKDYTIHIQSACHLSCLRCLLLFEANERKQIFMHVQLIRFPSLNAYVLKFKDNDNQNTVLNISKLVCKIPLSIL